MVATKKFGFLLLMITYLNLGAQYIRKSVGSYSSELEKKEIKGKSLYTKISFSSNSGLLVIEDNLAAIKLDDIKLDTSKVYKEKQIPLKFQTTIQGNLNQIFKDNKNANLIRVEGTLTINNISKDCVGYFAPIILNASSNEVLMDFELKFDLKDFDANNLGLQLKGLTELDIEDGYVLKVE